MLTSSLRFKCLKYAAPASDDTPKGKSINCKSGDDSEEFFLSNGSCNKPTASHPGCVHVPKNYLY